MQTYPQNARTIALKETGYFNSKAPANLGNACAALLIGLRRLVGTSS